MAGTPVNPLSGVGSNNDNPNPKIPKAIFVGGGFSDEELSEMMGKEEAKDLPWVCPIFDHQLGNGQFCVSNADIFHQVTPSPAAKEEVQRIGNPMEQRDSGPGKTIMEVVVRRVKACLQERGLAEGYEGKVIGPGELWKA
jgi:hypothetical protein